MSGRAGRRATYRVQVRADFGLDEVAALVDYLDALGVSHLHTSPILQAAAGSTHGYDVVAHDRVSAELGGEAARARVVAALAARELGWMLDVVPNHMAIGTRDNAWWWDVLEHGPASRYARYFDVEWRGSGAVADDDRIVLPILGERYADAVEQGAIAIARDGAAFEARYGDHRLPLSPRSLGAPLAAAARAVGSMPLGFVADGLAALPPRTDDHDAAARRHRDHQVLTSMLAEGLAREPSTAAAIDAELRAIAADPARLDALLEAQWWRLFHWRAASSDISYRRFFDIATLIGVRVEDPLVARDVHRLPLGWLEAGELDGLRIDHVDGLRDPTAYLTWLRARAPDAWIVVEKILAPGERLPAAWPIDGTTGYDLMRVIDGAFVDPDATRALDDVWLTFAGEPTAWDERSRAARREVIDALFGHERDRLVDLAVTAARPRRELRDATRRDFADAITHLVASYPVYRTYVRPGAPPTDDDRAHLDAALEAARAEQPEIDARLWAFLAGALLRPATPRDAGDATGAGAAELELALRTQQLTGAVMAKGVEDTLYYRIVRYIAANEVGGDGGRIGLSLDEIHAQLAAAPPRGIVATATHDTKRGEDVRARLAVLSELPDAWAAAVARWSARAAKYRTGDGLPDRATEYLWWQTWVGAWPLDAARATAFMEKAAREAKRATSWHRPQPRYEDALRAFVTATLADVELAADVAAFVASIAAPTLRNSLARTLVKLTAPGAPEIYQGAELWDFALVDPDNRRPVDYGARRALLERAATIGPEDALAGAADGLAKLWLIRRALHLRRRRPEAFDGAYHRLDVRGPLAARVLAFARGGELAAIVPRLTAIERPGWDETRVILDGEWHDVLADRDVGGETSAAALWSRFPVALLVRRRS